MAFINTTSRKDERIFRHIWRISPRLAIKRWGVEYAGTTGAAQAHGRALGRSR